jgi:hypothetical protein
MGTSLGCRYTKALNFGNESMGRPSVRTPWTVPFRLSSHRAHDPLGDGVIQSLGRSDRQHSLSKPHAELLGQRNKRKRLSSILIKARSTFRLAPISWLRKLVAGGRGWCGKGRVHSSGRQDDSPPLCTSHHVIVGNNVSIRRNHHARTNRPLSLDPRLLASSSRGL